MVSTTGAESLSLGFQPVAKTGAALFLSTTSMSPRGKGASRRFLATHRSGVRAFANGKEAEQKVGGLARLRCGADDGAIVLAEHLEPGADIVGVAHGGDD